MENVISPRSKYAIGVVASIVAIIVVQSFPSGFIGQKGAEAKDTLEMAIYDKAQPQVRAVMSVQRRHSHRLMAIPEVVGTATGLDAAGRVAVIVFTKEEVGPGTIPETLEEIPVVRMNTGKIWAMKRILPTFPFPRPTPIGVSAGNEGECSAGTIGARVRDGAGNVYALSNNHVFALENNASLGSNIVQPARFDKGCARPPDPDDVIGMLAQFVPVSFSIFDDNIVDAAIAVSSPEFLGNATPRNGYGIPRSARKEPSVGLKVKKYGRTTSLTKGKIFGINATINVEYESGLARFVNQIVVVSSKPFIGLGDSGSLLVTKRGAYPVGLLFAGNPTGIFAFANPIDAVLEAFGVMIDGR